MVPLHRTVGSDVSFKLLASFPGMELIGPQWQARTHLHGASKGDTPAVALSSFSQTIEFVINMESYLHLRLRDTIYDSGNFYPAIPIVLQGKGRKV